MGLDMRNKIFDKIQDSLYIGWLGGIVAWFCGLFSPICETDQTVKEAREKTLKERGYN